MEYEVFLSCLLLTPVPLLVLLPQTTLSHVFTASSLSSNMESVDNLPDLTLQLEVVTFYSVILLSIFSLSTNI